MSKNDELKILRRIADMLDFVGADYIQFTKSTNWDEKYVGIPRGQFDKMCDLVGDAKKLRDG